MKDRLMLGRLILLLCLALPMGSAIAQTKSTVPLAVEEPRDVVAAIYEKNRSEMKKRSPQSPFAMPAMRAKYFSKSFDLLVTAAETKAAHDKEASLEFDPIVAGQDADLSKLVLKTDLIETGKAVVSASFLNFGKPTVVTYDFVKEDGGWKVNDIKGTTEKEAWSVRKILKGSGREPKALPGMKNAEDKPDATVKVAPARKPEEQGADKRLR